MLKLLLRIELKSDLCAASGMSAGNFVDSDLSFDSFGLPVIPGRRLKGVLRDAAQFLCENGIVSDDDMNRLFGTGLDETGALAVGNAELETTHDIKSTISANRDDGYYSPRYIMKLYTYIKGQTALKDGVAADTTLRYTRVLRKTDPICGGLLAFHAPITLDDDSLKPALECCCKAVRHIGLMRNRGLGFVKLMLKPDRQYTIETAEPEYGEEPITLEYTLLADAGLVLPGCAERLTVIPGRSAIGCFAANYIKSFSNGNVGDDAVFSDLFLNGTVCWSDITPTVGGVRTVPTPLMLVELKNEKKLINRYADTGDQKVKQKTLEGSYAAISKGCIKLTSLKTVSASHFRRAIGDEPQQLYSVTSVGSQLKLCGRVTFPQKYKSLITALIKGSHLRFGGSKTAQYSSCHLMDGDAVKPVELESDAVIKKGEPVFLLLEADICLIEAGIPVLDNQSVRSLLAAAFTDESGGAALNASMPLDSAGNEFKDYVIYHTVGGFNSVWHLSKQQRTVVSGGSVFCLTANEDALISREKLVGEYLQEGMGCVRVITKTEMDGLIKIVQADPDCAEYGEAENKLFKEKVERMKAMEEMPKIAHEIYREIKSRNELKNLVNRRIRLMAEEAESLEDLSKRIESIKRKEARESGEFLYQEVKKRATKENWRALMLAVLHLHYYDTDRRKDGGK